MEEDLRYKVEHIGDYFVDMLLKVVSASGSSARRVILIYDIRRLAKKKENLIRKLGVRITEIRKENPSLIEDEEIREILKELDEIEERFNIFIKEREGLLCGSCLSYISKRKRDETPQEV